MYTIIGGDGKEYGPVSAEQVQAWLAAGRANQETRIKIVGEAEWKTIADLPEFGGRATFSQGAAAGPASPVAAALSQPATAAAFSPLECFVRSWEVLTANFLPLVSASAVVLVVQLGINLLVGLGVQTTFDFSNPSAYFHSATFRINELAQIFLEMPLFAGLQFYILKKVRGQAVTVGAVFAGFSASYLPLVLAYLLSSILEALGFVCLILPGIYLVISYLFILLLILDRRMSVWAALETSRKAIGRHWWSMLLICIISVVLMVAGILALGVGVFIALPLVIGAFVQAYEELCGRPVANPPEPVNSGLPTA